MRSWIILAGVMAGLASPAWAEDTGAVVDSLQTRLQAQAIKFGPQTTIDDVDIAIGPVTYGVDQPCSSACTRQYDGHGGGPVPFQFLLYQFTASVDASSPDAFNGWQPEHAFLDVSIGDDVPATVCFSEEGWNKALTDAGWEPLKAFNVTKKAYSELDLEDLRVGGHAPERKIDVHITGYVTRHGETYLTLASAGNSARFLSSFNPPKAIKAVEALGDCLRDVTVGDSLDLKDDYATANGLPPPERQ